MNNFRSIMFVPFICLIFFTLSWELHAQSLKLNSDITNYFQTGTKIILSLNNQSIFNQNKRVYPSINRFNTNISSPDVQDILLFGNFGNNILDSFKGNNIYYHLAGIASTILLVNLNVDYNVEHFFNQHEEFGKWGHPVVFSGMFLPFIAGGSLYAYSKIKNDDETLGASFAVLQASLIELIYNSTLKALTGRPNPDWRHNSDMESLSKTFRFGFLRGGMFWGWPSGHTSTTMAVVSSLINYYPDKTWIKIAGYSLVAYTIFGVSSVNRGGMHWFSDAIAAAFMSYAIGSTVGKYYRKVYSSKHPAAGISSTTLPPVQLSPFGLNFSIQF
ncbi:MAG: phosphatase PAP2 family protein [Ignavibacteriaceae bacterium]